MENTSSYSLYYQIPYNQERTKSARREERIPGRARLLGRLGKLPVASLHITRCRIRVGHELFDTSGLCRERIDELCLQLGDFYQ